jgi:transcriptional regulator with XRE-family HTH domain/tetratricopeptide (TPR) repeat protein
MEQGEQYEIASFGEWVQRRRKLLDLTQAELAKQVGCAVVTIKKIERDERRPSLQVAELLADRLVIPAGLREDFLRMGRGKYVPGVNLPPQELRPPDFLLKSRPVERRQSAFVARQQELAYLESRLTKALSADGQVTLILGEAGTGKTTLMNEFARRATDAHPDLIVVSGSCNAQAGAGDPYLPFRDVFGMLTGDLETSWASGALTQVQVQRLWALMPVALQTISDYGPDLLGIFVPWKPLLQRISSNLTGTADWLKQFQAHLEEQAATPANLEQKQLLEQVTEVLRALATNHPLILMLDDLQWVDDASKNLLFHLGRRLAGTRLLILGAYRPSEVTLGRRGPGQEPAEQHPLELVINEFIRYYGDIQLDLTQSAPADGRAFIDAYLDSEPNKLGEKFRSTLFQHTQGQPLFTVELLRSMQESGYLARDAGEEWFVRHEFELNQLPARVEAVIEQRLNRLGEMQKYILDVASVEGEIFIGQVVGKVLGLEEQVVLHELSQVISHQHRLAHEHSEVNVGSRHLSRYQFTHVLFQEYLYGQLSPGERRLYHRDVANALEEILFETRPLQYWTQPEEYLQAWEALRRDNPGSLETFGPALVHHFWHGEEWFQAAGYALQVGVLAMQIYALREAMDYFERVLQALDKTHAAPLEIKYETLLLWAESAFKFRPYAEQLGQLAVAENIARELGDSPRLIKALHWQANVYLARGLWTRAAPILLECLSLSEALHNEALAIRPIFFKGLMTTYADPHGSLLLLERALDLARKYNDLHIQALALATHGQVYALLGDFARSQEDLSLARIAAENTQSPLTESDVELMAAWSYLSMGDMQHSLEFGQRSVERAIATDNMDCICSGLVCVGYVHLELQDFTQAETAFQNGIERSQVSGATFPRLMGQAGLAMVQYCQGHREAVGNLEAVLAEMLANQDFVGAANTSHMLGTCFMQSGQAVPAETQLRAALDFYRQAGMRPYMLRSLTVLAQFLEGQGQIDEAIRLRGEAAQLMGTLS